MDTFDLPEDADLLASGDIIPNQAFRVGDRAWARSSISRWIGLRSRLDRSVGREGELLEAWGEHPRTFEAEATPPGAHEGREAAVPSLRRFVGDTGG